MTKFATVNKGHGQEIRNLKVLIFFLLCQPLEYFLVLEKEFEFLK